MLNFADWTGVDFSIELKLGMCFILIDKNDGDLSMIKLGPFTVLRFQKTRHEFKDTRFIADRHFFFHALRTSRVPER